MRLAFGAALFGSIDARNGQLILLFWPDHPAPARREFLIVFLWLIGANAPLLRRKHAEQIAVGDVALIAPFFRADRWPQQIVEDQLL